MVNEDAATTSETSCFPNDIANYVNDGSLTDEQKYNALCNVWVPSANYPFPLVNDRKFRLDWMKLFPWLMHSPKVDRAFCINCVLFGSECMGTHNPSKLQRLFKTPFTSWKVGPAKFREHSEKSPLHKAATARAAVLTSHMEQKSAPTDVMLDEMKRQHIEENRKLPRPITGAIIPCGRQNIPLRGHRDYSSNYLSDDVNCGSFIEILKYGAMCAGKTVKTTQNEIDICGDLITKKIADEAGLTRKAVATTIKEFLRYLNLPIEDCRGHLYDGAGNMAGQLSAVAAKIQEKKREGSLCSL